MMIAAARIGVDQVDQFGDGVDAVAEDLGRLAPGGGHDPPAHHQQAIVVARGELLDQHRFALLEGGVIGGGHLLAVVRFVATPRPWLPSRGLTTTGRPISRPPPRRPRRRSTGRPSGTGTPTAEATCG